MRGPARWPSGSCSSSKLGSLSPEDSPAPNRGLSCHGCEMGLCEPWVMTAKSLSRHSQTSSPFLCLSQSKSGNLYSQESQQIGLNSIYKIVLSATLKTSKIQNT